MKALTASILLILISSTSLFAEEGACLQKASNDCTQYSADSSAIETLKSNCDFISGEWVDSCSAEAYCEVDREGLNMSLHNPNHSDMIKKVICQSSGGELIN